jgi:hypothetical protein
VQSTTSIDYRDRKKVNYRDHSQEIAADLQAAMELFAGIANELKE